MKPPELSPTFLLAAYASGVFPMADDEGELHWLAPDPRAILELRDLRVSRSLRATLKKAPFEVTVDQAFERVIEGCAEREEGTWISPAIDMAYTRLHRGGFAHSVEVWRDGELVGGLYGVSIGGAFFGESMFHRATDASKIAMVRLVERMISRGFVLLDIQFMTDHLKRFGAKEIPRAEYQQRLRCAIDLPCSFVDRPQVGGALGSIASDLGLPGFCGESE